MITFKISIITILFSLLSSTLADDSNLSSNLVGCEEVSCPKEGANDRCTVEDNTFLGIGLSRIPDVPSSLEGLSLIKGVNTSEGLAGNNSQPTRPFKSVYYLGYPPSISPQNLTGCAVIFNDPPTKSFSGSDTRAASGTCSDIIEQDCIDTILEAATDAANQADGDGDVCRSIERELSRSSFDKCSGFSGGSNSTRLGNFTIISFSKDMKEPVKNSTDCWPIEPKSDQLIQIGVNTTFGDYSANTLIDEAWKITPVMTVFTKGGNDSIVNQTSSQLTCLKVVTEENPDGEEDGSENSSVSLKISSSWFATGLVVLIVAILV